MTEIRAWSPVYRVSVEAAVARARELRATSAALRQSLSVTKKALADELNRARATQAAVREQLANLQAVKSGTAPSRPLSAVLQAVAILGKDESDLQETIHDLIVAHQAAVAAGDDDGQHAFARALMLIGRHLAAQIGPKASGIVLN